MRLVDLTHPMHPGMPIWPGDPPVEFRSAATVAQDGWNLLEDLLDAAPVVPSGRDKSDNPGISGTTEDDVRSGCGGAWVWLLPLALRGADGSPIRAVAAVG